ncbi:MAG TPA: STAS domain-containing protein [Pirellulales bacterium]|jgi:anti-sigma B factor antagonist
MAAHRRIEISETGEVTKVRFVDRKILDEANIQELGAELFGLVEQERRRNLLLNFTNVEFLSSAALGKLITLDKKVKANGGRLKLSNIRPEIYEVFAITKLNKLFDIKDDEADAIAAF